LYISTRIYIWPRFDFSTINAFVKREGENLIIKESVILLIQGEKRMDVNKAIFIGRLIKDPVNKKLSSGTDVCSAVLATNYSYKDSKTKKMQDKVDFHNLIFWGRLAQIVEKYIKKGDKIYVEGRISTRNWDDKNKVRHYKTEIIVSELIMLGGKKREESNKAVVKEETSIEEIDIDEE
jgi:single-strand DNA-binding protein